jgi:hypothetical protein
VFVLAAVMSLFTEDDILRDTPLIVAAVVVAALVVYVFSPINKGAHRHNMAGALRSFVSCGYPGRKDTNVSSRRE